MCEFCEGEKEISTDNGYIISIKSIIPLPSIDLKTGEMFKPDSPYHALAFHDDCYGEGDEVKISHCPFCGSYLQPDYKRQAKYLCELNKMREGKA